MQVQSRRDALRFALYYALFGIIWVLGTDLLAARIAPGISELQWLSTLKGWFFVLLSTGLVYLLAFGYAKSRLRLVRAAKDAEHRFRGLMEHAPDMVFWLAAPDRSRFHYVSLSVERLWGCPPERIYEDPAALLEFVHPDDRERFLTERNAARDGGSHEREYRIVRPDGEVRWMRSQSYPIEVEAAGFDGVAGVTQDVTLQKEAFGELRRSEALHRRAQHIGRIGHWELDPETRELAWSDEVYRILRVEAEEFVPTAAAFEEFVHPEDRAALAAAAEAALAGVAPLDIEHRIRRPDGDVRHVHERATLVEDEDGTTKLVGTVQDITERSRLQAEVEASRDLLRRYAATTIANQERERIVLAREIHDHVGQLLTLVRLHLARHLRHAEAGQREPLGETMAVVDSAVEELRNISARLRPPVLDQLGLVEALAAYVAEFEESSGLTMSFASDFESIAFGDEVEGHVFRIAQEALTNVARHARADTVRVELRSESNAVVLRVLDDGIGLPAMSAAQHDKFGLVGMRERAVLLGGELELVERDPNGLEVRVRVPYNVVDASGRQG